MWNSWTCSTFIQFFLLLSLISHSFARFEHIFKKIYIKSGNITEKKNKTCERLLIFLNIKMSAKSNKIELSKEFMVMRREGHTLWDVMSPLYRDKNEKDNSFRASYRRCSAKKMFLEISQNSQESTCFRVSFLIKLQASRNF